MKIVDSLLNADLSGFKKNCCFDSNKNEGSKIFHRDGTEAIISITFFYNDVPEKYGN